MEDKAKSKVYVAFVNGLKDRGLNYNDVINNWKYCGGDDKAHLNYWSLINGKEELPEHEDKCVCGHKIKKNCYLEYNDEILILGSCCIKRFLPKNSAGRTCDECGKSHRNRKINKCNDCKVGYCLECWKPMDISSYDRCAECYFKNIKFK